jgi:hypothetical protein
MRGLDLGVCGRRVRDHVMSSELWKQ